jgi:N-acetylgalactosamine kinase
MAARAPLYSIVLAAGKGRRMRNEVIHKVCFQIAGIPSIHRALDVYNRIGVVRNAIVVGELAGQVVETVGKKFRNVVFAYQPEALGTGDAARYGLQALSEVDPEARLLIVAGDKLIENGALTRLIDRFEETNADLGVLVSPAEWGGDSAGRVLFDADDRPVAIVELADIRLRACRTELRRVLEQTREEISLAELEGVVTRHVGRSGSLQAVLDLAPGTKVAEPIERGGILDRLASLPSDFRFGSGRKPISAEDALHAPLRNESVYLVRKKAIDFGLDHMPVDNAQGESYLTDAIGAIFCAAGENGVRYRVCHVESKTPYEVMSYNNPEELLRIEDHFHGQRRKSIDDLRRSLGCEKLKPVEDWLEMFPEAGPLPPETRTALAEYYGGGPDVLEEKRASYRAALNCFREHFGNDRQVILVRSPGRINVMGRHIDWQGGRCNLMAVTQEVLMAVSPRSDDMIEARNVDPKYFPDLSISLGKLVSQLNWDDWMSVVNSSELVRHLRESAGTWSLYIEAAMLRLQMAHPDQLLRGMDMAVCGNIPVAAGLSSSSAIVVATAESALALHGLELTPQQFVNFCGEGEWFVGTRGGSADHAAMKFGGRGTINHVGFHEFELLEQLAFPPSHALIVCNSLVQAKKASGAKEAFNARVGSYLAGVELIRRRFPRFAPFIRYVRDLNSETLQIPPSQIYELLLTLPAFITAGEVRRQFQADSEVWPALATHFGHVPEDALYPVRGVIMFGIAECARAIRAADCLRQHDLDGLGRLMNISHDGERCFATGPDGSAEPFAVDISDEAIRRLIADLTSQDLGRIERAQLYNQPGAYRCSTVEIDTIVDIARRTPGVAGAQIAGAGLGGCAMILVRAPDVELLHANLIRDYYTARSLPPATIRCSPSAGSCLVSIASIARA